MKINKKYKYKYSIQIVNIIENRNKINYFVIEKYSV